MSDHVVWRRWGLWAAHLYVDGKKQCSVKHGTKYANAKPQPSDDGLPLQVTELGVDGTPYGRTCVHCRRVWLTFTGRR